MVKIEKDSSALEPEIRPLIDAANTKEWKGALSILFLNGSVLEFSEEMKIPCLVSLTGPVEDLDRSIDLLMGRAKTNLTPLIVALARSFIPSILMVMRKTEMKVSSVEEESEETKVAMFVSGLLPELEKTKKRLTKAFVDGASTLSEMLVVSVFKGLQEFRDSHIHAALDEEDYEDMIEGLQKLGVIQPKLQINLCPWCANYEFTISNYPSFSEICPKCGSEWVSELLYTFERSFDKIKSENMDLPLFISRYLRHQVSIQAPLADFEVYPSAVVLADRKEAPLKRVELDVYLPQFRSGIECKVYEDAFAPMTKNRVGSIVGRLMEHVDKYLMLEINNVYFVTNLPESSAEKAQAALQSAIATQNLEQIKFEVIGGNVQSLLEWLDQMASSTARNFNVTLGRKIQEALPEESER